MAEQQKVHACPYAAALDHHHGSDHHNPSSDTDDEESSQDTAKLIQSCPVFQKGSCPFKDCQDEEQVRQALLQIPPSHYMMPASTAAAANGQEQQEGAAAAPPAGGQAFLNVLKELHAVAGHAALEDKKFQLACPVASKIPLNTKACNNKSSSSSDAAKNFMSAMEGYSLAAIMARMASEIEDHTGSDDEEENEDESSSSTGSAAATVEEPMKETASKKETQNNDQQENASQERRRSSASLSKSFKTGTAVSHQAAEDVHFVRNFIKGEIDRALYAELVVQLYHVYDKMECLLLATTPATTTETNKNNKNTTTATTHPALEQFRGMHEQLQRTEALREDVDFWHGPAEAARIVRQGAGVSPAARDYRDRLDHCAARDPLLLLAHSYTRYLGDLSGGKILARVARRALNLDRDGDGLAFYDFAQIPSAKKFKDQFRAALDALELSDEEIQRLVAEANVAFLLNMRLFEELDVKANLPGATVRPLAEALAYQEVDNTNAGNEENTNATTTNDASSGQCPFIVKPESKTAADKTATAKEIPAECPFSAKGTAATPTVVKKGRCPWPFIIAHDPLAALQDWQTWALIGVVLCWCYSKL